MVYFQLRKSFLIQRLNYLRWSLSKMELFTVKVSLHNFTKSASYKFYLSTVSSSAIITNSSKVSPKFKKEIALPVLENYLGDWFIWFMIEFFSSCSMKLRIYCGEDYQNFIYIIYCSLCEKCPYSEFFWSAFSPHSV